MPTHHFSDGVMINPVKWNNCKQIISKQMIDSGWNKHAGKFRDVMMRKARKLFYKS